MRGRIPDSFIEELLSRTDIVEVIERRLQMKRAGSEYQALCPFHEENTPSFTVSPRKQFYHCFGCGAHGSAIGFLMQFEGLEFRDAIDDLAKMAGLQVPETEARERKPLDDLFGVMDRAAAFFQAQLKAHPPAIDYLKQRGLSGEICRDFGIGYAPDSWDALQKHIGEDERSLALMKRAGLLSQGKNSLYDKFRDRIMFPIHDRRGRVIAFGGRALGEDGPKYLNSPETELFHKGRELYGLYRARRRAGRLNSVIVVEGYMDVVALAQFDLGNTVATLGTATTPEQAALLLRAADTVVYCFDGDEAGHKAAWRALEATLPRLGEGKQARFLFLPEGEDPDSLIRSIGADEFAARIENAQALSDYFFDKLSGEVDMQSLDGRARLVEEAMPLIETLPEGVFRDMMTERLESLARHRIHVARTSSARTGKGTGTRSTGRLSRMAFAIACLVQNPSFAELAGDVSEFRDSDIPGMSLFLELIDLCRNRPNMTTAQMLEMLHEHEAHSHLVTLACRQLAGDEESQAVEFQEALVRIRLQWLKDRLLQIGKQAGDPKKQEQYYALMSQIEELEATLQT